MWYYDYSRYQFKLLSNRGKIPEQHELLVDKVIVVIGSLPARPTACVGTEDVVEGVNVVKTELFHCLDVVFIGNGIAGHLYLW